MQTTAPDEALKAAYAAGPAAIEQRLRAMYPEPAEEEALTPELAKLKAQYEAAHPEPAAPEDGLTPALRALKAQHEAPPSALATAEPGAELPVPPMPTELARLGHAYDPAALAELGPLVAAAGVPLDELTMWVNVGHGQLAAGARTVEPALVDETVVSDAQLFAARAVLDRLSPSTRTAVERWIDATGLDRNPGFILWLAQYGR